MTKEEKDLKNLQLRQLQSLDLDTKIMKTKARIREFIYELDGKVYVSYSGGKDSECLLHLVRQEFPDVIAVYCDTGLEYPELKEFVKTHSNIKILKPEMNFTQVIEKYGFPVISKEVSLLIEYAKKGSSWALYKLQGKNNDGTDSPFKSRYIKFAYLKDAPFKISDKCCTIMKKNPFKKFEKESGLSAIIGTMTEESAMRKDAWIKNGCNAFNSKRIISQPLSFWTEQDILRYIYIYNIKIASVYGDLIEENGKLRFTKCQRTGCAWCPLSAHLDKNPNRFQRMKETHPQIYDYCINKLGLKEVLDYIDVKY